MKLIAENLGEDLSTLENYEVYYNEGDRGEARLYVSESLTEEQLQLIEGEILSQGVVLTEPIYQVARCVHINFEKRLAPLAIIAIVVGGIVVVVGGLLGWQIFKSTQLGVPLWVWGIAGAALIYLFFASETGKKTTGAAVTATKIYIGKGALK